MAARDLVTAAQPGTKRVNTRLKLHLRCYKLVTRETFSQIKPPRPNAPRKGSSDEAVNRMLLQSLRLERAYPQLLVNCLLSDAIIVLVNVASGVSK